MGIGRLTDLAIAGLLDGQRMSPDAWAHQRRGATRTPAISPGGSNNFALVARICDAVAGRKLKSDPAEWRDPLVWLAAWYRLMATEGHDGYELQSSIYGDVHTCCAMIACELRIPEAGEYLQRQLALYARHLYRGRLVMPGCRCIRPENPALAQWALWLLDREVPRKPKPQRPLRLAQRMKAHRWISPRQQDLDAALATVVSAPGPLVYVPLEDGFASYFSEGPRCYAYPQPAVVARAGEVAFFRPPYTPKRGLPVGATTAELRTSIEGGKLVSSGGPWRAGAVEVMRTP